MKKLFTLLFFSCLATVPVSAQSEVMLQGFYWDSFSDTRWSKLTKQADELGRYFDLIWVPNSGYCSTSNNMGYMPMYYFYHNSTFGSEPELRKMIAEFKQKGLGTIADVVVNHHNTDGWFGFPEETYKGVTYQLQSTDICRNDDGGATLNEATKQGVSLSANNDTGEDWSGCRDLDHKSANVNKVVKAYLDFLLNDLGYTGFRYDMVKGFSASYVGDYNSTVKPAFSVGEYWDGYTNIKNWINGTRVNGEPQSGAFDFPFRYTVRDAINEGNWTRLDNANTLVADAGCRRYAVTFVENHDTERRSGAEQDPIKKDTLAANAYMMAMPGTPCVFLKHWMAAKTELKTMIEARHLAGITSVSSFEKLASSTQYYAVKTTGEKGALVCVVGKSPQNYTAPAGFRQLCSGKGYIYYINNEAYSDWDNTVARIADEAEAEKKQKEEEEKKFVPHTATVYVKADFTPLYLYVWDVNNSQLNGNWPGKRLDSDEACKVVIAGETWYKQTFNIDKYGYYINIIFNQGNGKPQTADINEISDDNYFNAFLAGGGVVYENVTEALGIDDIEVVRPESDAMFDLTGRRISIAQPGSIYIKNNKKYIAK